MDALLVLLGIAFVNAFTAYTAYRTRHDIKVLEKNTNSKMDQLIASTAKASLQEGKEIGRKEDKPA